MITYIRFDIVYKVWIWYIPCLKTIKNVHIPYLVHQGCQLVINLKCEFDRTSWKQNYQVCKQVWIVCQSRFSLAPLVTKSLHKKCCIFFIVFKFSLDTVNKMIKIMIVSVCTFFFSIYFLLCSPSHIQFIKDIFLISISRFNYLCQQLLCIFVRTTWKINDLKKYKLCQCINWETPFKARKVHLSFHACNFGCRTKKL